MIGTAVRFPKVKAQDTPGPTAYPSAAVAAFNKQAQSSRRTAATFKFGIGRAERDKKEKGRGRDTPGPDFIPPEGECVWAGVTSWCAVVCLLAVRTLRPLSRVCVPSLA